MGISTNDVATLSRFQKEEQAPQRFASDPSGAVTKSFGIDIRFAGKTYANRATYVIGSDGKIVFKVVDEVPQSNVATTYAWAQKHPAVKEHS